MLIGETRVRPLAANAEHGDTERSADRGLRDQAIVMSVFALVQLAAACWEAGPGMEDILIQMALWWCLEVVVHKCS
jgi:hypothetical protein